MLRLVSGVFICGAQAIADFTAVIKDNPRNSHALFRRGFAYKSLKRFDLLPPEFPLAVIVCLCYLAFDCPSPVIACVSSGVRGFVRVSSPGLFCV